MLPHYNIQLADREIYRSVLGSISDYYFVVNIFRNTYNKLDFASKRNTILEMMDSK